VTIVWLLVAALAGATGGAAVAGAVAARRRRMLARRVRDVATTHGADLLAGSPEETVGVDATQFAAAGADPDAALGLLAATLAARERNDAEAEVGRRRLTEALDALNVGVLVADHDGVTVLRNEPAEEFHDARHGEALVEAAVGELLAAAVDGRAAARTLELFGPPRRVVSITACPLTDGDRVLGGLALMEDLTERRRLEEVRRDFVANVSHELKTPIGALSLLAETLMVEADVEVSRRLAGRMVGEATRVSNTIDDLLVLSRIESDSLPPHERVPVIDILHEVLERMQPAAEVAGMRVEVAPFDAALAVVADRRQLVSAVANLVDNAVKYSDGSDGNATVMLRAQANGERAELSVEDRGIGIPAREVERVFERFYRVDHARSRQTGGTGLGLAIVRHVAANHDGEVRVESRLGEGSTFTLSLPLAPAGANPAAADSVAASPDGHATDGIAPDADRGGPGVLEPGGSVAAGPGGHGAGTG
jgi:two-component system sensor histidine kinase SenX3